MPGTRSGDRRSARPPASPARTPISAANGWHWAAHGGYNWVFGATLDHVPGWTDDQMVRFGWTGGAGAEWRLHRRWAARLDYRYAKYEDKEYSFFGNSGTDQVFAKTTLKTSVVSLGVSYRF